MVQSWFMDGHARNWNIMMHFMIISVSKTKYLVKQSILFISSAINSYNIIIII